ncbi:hypothetical protein OH77DRAFT_1422004 [Trametes cingulata]|nr:hypothetical protein OH77DRAFT_1422004 [Trametes cingulata]
MPPKKPTPNGMNPEVMEMFQQVLSGYKPRGSTSSLDDIMRHLATQDPSTVEALMNAVSNADASREVDIATFDYTSVPVKKDSFWVVQMLHTGFQDRNGRFEDEYFPGSEPAFQIIIYDDRNSYRAGVLNPEPGLPSSDFILRSIKKAIATPVPPLRPALPSLLLIARKLSVHVDALRPFLDSLPKPFTWRLETAEEEDEVASGIHAMNLEGIAKGLRNAESEKALGNQAIARKDRAGAVNHYTEAIESLRDAWGQSPTDEETKKIKTMLAVCFSNRAASWLLPGDGQDARKALKDADDAIWHDAEYGKAYYRKAKAHQLLEEPSQAIDTLCEALGKQSLSSEKGLVDTLVELYGGFPTEAEELRKFCLDKFKDESGDKRARHITEFRRRAEEHIKRVFGPEATIDGLE